MTATGLVVTDLSQLDVGLDIRGDFRGLIDINGRDSPHSPTQRTTLIRDHIVAMAYWACSTQQTEAARGSRPGCRVRRPDVTSL